VKQTFDKVNKTVYVTSAGNLNASLRNTRVNELKEVWRTNWKY